MNLTPDFESFQAKWRAGKHQVVWTELISDLETPVSAMLKLGRNQPYTFLLESIEGGAIRGRYSIIGREPDLIWRCQKNCAAMCHFPEHTTPNSALAAQNCGQGQTIYQPLDRLTFTPSKLPPLEDLKKLLEDSRIDDPNQPQPMAAGLFGYLGYDMTRQMEKLPENHPSPIQVPEGLFIRPTLMAIFDQIENRFSLITPVWHNPAISAQDAYAKATSRLKKALEDINTPLAIQPVGQPHTTGTSPCINPASSANGVFSGGGQTSAPAAAISNQTEAEFTNMVDRAKEYMRAGDIFQVVLSQRFSTPFTAPPFELYRSIRRLDPSPFLFYFNFADFSIVGTSPEILVRVRDKKITIRPIAGTRPRGQSNQTDAELAADLLADPKECAEHLMLLDLGRNDAGRVAKTGTVKVTAQNQIEYYKHVMHIVSNVEAELAEGHTPLEALIGGFPAGTVSGAPKIRAMEIIAELEKDSRGIYGGCIGYFGANGNMDTCIAIRTAIIKNQTLYVQAGAGIVYDSNPLSEHRECAAKARGLLKAAEQIKSTPHKS